MYIYFSENNNKNDSKNYLISKLEFKIQESENLDINDYDFFVYVIESEKDCVYNVAKMIDSSNKRPNKTILCADESYFSKEAWSSLCPIWKIAKENGAILCGNLITVSYILNYANEHNNMF